MKKVTALLLALLFCFAFAAAEEEPMDLFDYYGKDISELQALLPEAVWDGIGYTTPDETVYFSADTETGLLDFIYISAPEANFCILGMAPGMDAEEIRLAIANADMLIDETDYELDATVFAVDSTFSFSVTVEFGEDGLCAAVSAISYE